MRVKGYTKTQETWHLCQRWQKFTFEVGVRIGLGKVPETSVKKPSQSVSCPSTIAPPSPLPRKSAFILVKLFRVRAHLRMYRPFYSLCYDYIMLSAGGKTKVNWRQIQLHDLVKMSSGCVTGCQNRRNNGSN